MIYPDAEIQITINDEVIEFIPWQPSTWPDSPTTSQFPEIMKKIFKETMVGEINDVIKDILKSNKSLVHRGHAVAIPMLCAIDSLSKYAYVNVKSEECPSCGRSDRVGPKFAKFIETYFPNEYKPYSNEIYKLYRNGLVHEWNLFRASMWPDNRNITKDGENLSFGLLNFSDALNSAVDDFLIDLANDPKLQKNVMDRYSKLKSMARH
ncbi:MAG: hypothetical protein O8C66_05890 [Candidatus Methanoperedens sp.]|nr:hypothetical protein [Candidatus Methanoperedens sp.]MCZ7370021.1 hypothetical protein [Candidatus Methanoperedens sp.]